MRTVKTAATLLAGLLLLAAAGAARAQEDEGDAPPPEHQMSAAKLKDKLGLTDEQVQKLDASMKSAKETMKPLGEALKQDMAKLKEQVRAKAKDDEIQSTLDSLQKDRTALREAMEKHMDESKGILTPTQRAKMVLGMAKGRKSFWQRSGRGKGKDRDEDGKKG